MTLKCDKEILKIRIQILKDIHYKD